MLDIKTLFLLRRENLCRLNSALDLPAIELPFSKVINRRIIHIYIFGGEPREEVLPDLLAVCSIQCFLRQTDVDAGFKGGVQVAHAVSGEDHDAGEVFESAEEDCES
jgi:hypothetical protein